MVILVWYATVSFAAVLTRICFGQTTTTTTTTTTLTSFAQRESTLFFNDFGDQLFDITSIVPSSTPTFNFTILQSITEPGFILDVSYDNKTAIQQEWDIPFIVNYTDISDAQVGPAVPEATYQMYTNPYSLQNLRPGHAYRIEFVGKRKHFVGLVYTTMGKTVPRVPIVFNESRFQSSNTSITLVGTSRSSEYLQDYILVTYGNANGEKVKNVTDPNAVNITLEGLKPGSLYDISVVAYRIYPNTDQQLTSKAKLFKVATVPLPPKNVLFFASGVGNLTVAIEAANNTGLSYFLVTFYSPDQTIMTSPESIEIRGPRWDHVFRNLMPGAQYHVTVVSVFQDRVSAPYHKRTAVVKPLPPINIAVWPDYKTANFAINITLPPYQTSRATSCSLLYSPAAPDRSPFTQSISNGVCLFKLFINAGIKYTFKAWAVGLNKTQSDYFEKSIVIGPSFDRDQFNISVVPLTNLIVVSWPNVAFWDTLVGSQSNLTASISEMNESGDPRLPDAIDTSPGAGGGEFIFRELISGQCYQVTIATSVGTMSSSPETYTVRTSAPKIQFYNEMTDTQRRQAEIGLKFKGTISTSCKLIVTLQRDDLTEVGRTTIHFGSGQQPFDRLNFTGLQPYSQYHVRGVTKCGRGNNASMEVQCPQNQQDANLHSFKTNEARPGVVQNVKVVQLLPYEVTLSWSPPKDKNGLIENYEIGLEHMPTTSFREDNQLVRKQDISGASGITVARFTNLTGGQQYNVRIKAKTTAGYGPDLPTPFLFNTTLEKPPKPDTVPQLVPQSVGQDQFAVVFHMGQFDSKNGVLIKYDLIVAEVKDNAVESTAQSASLIRTWRQVQNFEFWEPYYALSLTLPPLSSKEHQENGREAPGALYIGQAKNCGSDPAEICNGPLRPGRSYRIKVRGYTTPDLYTDTKYSTVISTDPIPGTPAGVIVTVVLVLIILIIGVIALVMFMRHRGIQPSDMFKRIPLPSSTTTNHRRPPPLPLHDQLPGVVNGGVNKTNNTRRGVIPPNVINNYQPSMPPLPTWIPGVNYDISRPVLKSRWAEHVKLMKADSDFRFSDDFEMLKNIPMCAGDASNLPYNRGKNRFVNIFPYDHSRVNLIPEDDEETMGSDYINANYIPGYNSKREFIATQGPMASTCDDFWRMVWEQNCPAIVNLTLCVEKGREKCFHYWPNNDDGPVTYGSIEVKVMNETIHAEWCMRELQVQKDNELRSVRHYHYISWPDFGVPERPDILVKFVRAVRSRHPPDVNCHPIIVHCSAGVGRSGTFIAIDRLTQHIKTHETIDVFGIVREMRRERVFMVQSESQYICIHQAIQWVLENGLKDDVNNLTISGSALSVITLNNNGSAKLSSSSPAGSGSSAPMEVHQNPVFEDDEGIAESGL